jgi:hypothetical protein
MPTQFSDSNFPVSVLNGTNLYSLISSSIYFHWPSLCVSWQRIYNTFAVGKSFNHTLILLLIYDDSVLKFNPQSGVVWSGLVLAIGCSYIDTARTTQKTRFYCYVTSLGHHVITTEAVHWPAGCCLATSYNILY